MAENKDLLFFFIGLIIIVVITGVFSWMIVSYFEKHILTINRVLAKMFVDVLHFLYVDLKIKIFAKQVKSLIYRIFG